MSHPRSSLRVVAGVVAAAGLLAALLWWIDRSGFDWVKFRQAFASANPVWLTGSGLLVLATYLGRALRWQAMVQPLKPTARLWPILEASILGFTASVLLGRAGEFVRPYLIARREGLTISSQAAVWFLERLLDLIAVLMLFGFALTRLDSSDAARVGPEIRWVFEYGGWLIGMIGAVSLLVLVAFRYFTVDAVSRVEGALGSLTSGPRLRVMNLVRAFAEGMESTREPRVFRLIFFYTLLEWMVIALGYYCLLRSFSATQTLTPLDSLVVLGFVSFGGVVQLPGVGGGQQIVTVLVLTQLFAIAQEPASAVALMVWLVGFGLIVPVGVLLAVYQGAWSELFARRPQM
jgi:uncharacterized protein (TIRG00374 family)